MLLQSAPRSVYNTVKLLLDENAILTIGFNSKNWGDALNPVLIQKISGKTPLIATEYTYNIKSNPVYSAIGSVLESANANNCGHGNLVVWGTGFISSRGRLKVQPKKICAVRGPSTRELLLEQGYECPEIYGDPALLYPKFYRPESRKRYKLGIVPHYVDKNHAAINNFQNDPDILIIDILGGIHNVVDQICSCQKIASSSLHGIIAADAYGIPSTWIKFSDNVVGNGFKFFDYFKSVGRTDEGPLVIQEDSSIDDILDTYYRYKLDLDLKELWDACPFRDN
jgi:pyruvyltransferase